jgi:choline dehydrogenase-like flavoprotein
VKSGHSHVLIIGTGAAGGIIAKTLAEAGLDVVCLDQGPWFSAREKPHFRSDWEWQRTRTWSTTVNTRKRANDYPIDTVTENTLMWNGVGGSTVVYTAVCHAFVRAISARGGARIGAQLADQLRRPIAIL